jgi:Mlc titration factor MtfA (ptsG expression regulator)
MPQGFDNLGIRAYYAEALSKQVLGKEEYALKNHGEFFAVTASIFLAGKETMHEPKTRAQLKEKMPKYYKFLVELFGFDPDASSVTPVAAPSNPPQELSDAMYPG